MHCIHCFNCSFCTFLCANLCAQFISRLGVDTTDFAARPHPNFVASLSLLYMGKKTPPCLQVNVTLRSLEQGIETGDLGIMKTRERSEPTLSSA